MTFSKKEFDTIVNQAIEKGLGHYSRNENEQAAALFGQVLCVDPDNLVALQILGLIESKIPGLEDQAVARLKRAEELAPDNPDVHNNLGLVYSWLEEKNMAEATRHYLKAIELNPQALHFYSNLGIHYKSLHRLQEAEEILLAGLKMEDASTILHFNYATLLGEQKRWQEAKKHYEQAITLDPDFASAHYNLATVLLNEGNWQDGWREYEWRWETYPVFKKLYERFPLEKRWDGKQDITKKRMLLYAEQGMGDTIQFVRFVQRLQELGVYCMVEEHGDLIALMRTLQGPQEIIRFGDPLPDFDYHCSLLSLPHLLKLWQKEDLHAKPYLSCNYGELPNLTIRDDKYWLDYPEFRIGIVWAGNPVHRHDPHRSTYLRYFRTLQLPNSKLFSLQKDTRPRFWPGIGERDLTEGAEGMGVVDMKDFLMDYNATAAVIDRMDLIISVDTATAHLAAAMGKPVWLLLPYYNDWRWLAEGERTHWYDSMRLFRQTDPGDWEGVFAKVRLALQELQKGSDK